MAGYGTTVDLNKVMGDAPSQDQYFIFDIEGRFSREYVYRYFDAKAVAYMFKVNNRSVSLLFPCSFC